MSIKAMVVDAGGGEVRLILHRDTMDYPQIGERVLLWTTDDCCRLDHCNCPPEFHDDWSATAQSDGPARSMTAIPLKPLTPARHISNTDIKLLITCPERAC